MKKKSPLSSDHHHHDLNQDCYKKAFEEVKKHSRVYD